MQMFVSKSNRHLPALLVHSWSSLEGVDGEVRNMKLTIPLGMIS